MATRWVKLVDPTGEEVQDALPPGIDPDVADVLAAPAVAGREPRPLIEGHDSYVFADLVAMRPTPGGVVHQEIDVVATPQLTVTSGETFAGRAAFDTGATEAAVAAGEAVGVVFQRLAYAARAARCTFDVPAGSRDKRFTTTVRLTVLGTTVARTLTGTVR